MLMLIASLVSILSDNTNGVNSNTPVFAVPFNYLFTSFHFKCHIPVFMRSIIVNERKMCLYTQLENNKRLLMGFVSSVYLSQVWGCNNEACLEALGNARLAV